MKDRHRYLTPIIVVALIAVLTTWLFTWWNTPPLRITVADGVATVDVQNLGEYNSWLSEIIIRDTESNHVVWRAIPIGPNRYLNLWTFKIHSGINPSRFNIGDGTKPVDLVVAIPNGISSLNILPAHRYEVIIRSDPWFGDRLAFHSKATFLL